MAHFTTQTGLENFTGALKKHKQESFTITRRKAIKDPITGETLKHGPKEIYVQDRRDYELHPLTTGETKQRSKWAEACREAAHIIKDKSHPRYMELYNLWREHLQTAEQPMQFPNFVRSTLCRE